METQVTDLEKVFKRLDKLEKQNSILKMTILTILLIIGSLAVMGQASSSKVIEAQRFVLRDPSGIKRGEFFVDGSTIRLDLGGVNDTLRARLEVREPETRLSFSDKFDNEFASVSAHPGARGAELTLRTDTKAAPIINIKSITGDKTQWYAPPR